MSFQECFKADKKFEDKINFPYGFQKSGEFTIEQARILEMNGIAYAELSSGTRKPVGEIEREFVAYCSGKKEATNLHEKVWQRYLMRVNNNKLAISFNKRRQNSEVSLDECG